MMISYSRDNEGNIGPVVDVVGCSGEIVRMPYGVWLSAEKKLTEFGCSLSEQAIIIGEDSFRPDGSDHDLAINLCMSFQNKGDYGVIDESLTATRQDNACYAKELVKLCREYIVKSSLGIPVNLTVLERRAANFMLHRMDIRKPAKAIIGDLGQKDGED